ncbi:MAG: septum formation initiator family protein [Desulfomonile tiedjei]|nr:septum formation initiator family protein [Desulfomonile tiedjei]
MAIIIAAAVLVIGMFYVWHRMQLVQIGYEISSLEEKNRDLKKRTRELTLEISSLQSPGELEKKAAKQGLVSPPMDRVVHVP